jgi:hypothetical protein
MVEIGTYHGEFAENVLVNWRGGHLHCVDPWTDQPDSDYRDGCANGGVSGGRNPMVPIFLSARKRLARFGHRVTIHKLFSDQALEHFADQSLDCVYIDGNHRYESVMHDLRRWWEKLRTGGLIATHDCYIRDDAVQRCGAWDAVWEFGHEIGIQPFLTNCSSAWWIKE